jgi:hypothetical protein
MSLFPFGRRCATTTLRAGVSAAVVSSVLAVASTSASAAPTWSTPTSLNSDSSTTTVIATPNPLGGSVLFYSAGSKPLLMTISAKGVTNAPVHVPTVAALDNLGTPIAVKFLANGASIVTWTLTTYGSKYMAYRSPSGQFGPAHVLPSNFSGLAVRDSEVLTSEGGGTGITVESWTLSPAGILTLKSGPTSVYTGQPLFNQSWVALDANGTAAVVVLGSTNSGPESLHVVTRSALGKWSTTTILSGAGQYVIGADVAVAPGGRAVATWVIAQTATAAHSYESVRLVGHLFATPTSTGLTASTYGAYILVRAAAGADGSLAVSTTRKTYSSGSVFSYLTSVRIGGPVATTLGASIATPYAVFPQSLSTSGGAAIVGSITGTVGTGNATYASSYSYQQSVYESTITPGSSSTTHLFGGSSALYDPNGGEHCGCPQSPPAASMPALSLDPSGNGVVAGQLIPGLAYQRSTFVAQTPSPPLSFKAVGGVGRITLTWTTPIGNGGSPITGYNLFQGTKSHHEGTTPVNKTPRNATTRQIIAMGAKKGLRYYFILRAMNKVGSSAPSIEVSAIAR